MNLLWGTSKHALSRKRSARVAEIWQQSTSVGSAEFHAWWKNPRQELESVHYRLCDPNQSKVENCGITQIYGAVYRLNCQQSKLNIAWRQHGHSVDLDYPIAMQQEAKLNGPTNRYLSSFATEGEMDRAHRCPTFKTVFAKEILEISYWKIKADYNRVKKIGYGLLLSIEKGVSASL